MPKNLGGPKNRQKILRDFWQLSTMIADISGTDPHIENWPIFKLLSNLIPRTGVGSKMTPLQASLSKHGMMARWKRLLWLFMRIILQAVGAYSCLVNRKIWVMGSILIPELVYIRDSPDYARLHKLWNSYHPWIILVIQLKTRSAIPNWFLTNVRQERPAVADKPVRRLLNDCAVYVYVISWHRQRYVIICVNAISVERSIMLLK